MMDSRKQSILSLWLIRLFGYDGLVPALVIAIPALISWVFGRGVVIEVIAVILPIVAFFWRSAIGLHQIEGNTCPNGVRISQKVALCLALLTLALVDAFLILAWGLPANALAMDDYLVTLAIYGVYLCLMAFASFPGLAVATSGNATEQ